MMTSLFAALASFFIAHKGDIAAKMAASAGYDLLKKGLNIKPLIQKLKRFFSKDSDSESFVRSIFDSTVSKDSDPVNALQQNYRQLTAGDMPSEILPVLREWFEENQDAIAQINTVQIEQSSGIAVGVQNAKGNIFNITGDYNINEPKKEN
jgi:hypothetical protein